MTCIPTLPSPNSGSQTLSGSADSASSRTRPDHRRRMTRFLKKGSPVHQNIEQQDTEGWVGEVLGRRPIRQSQEKVADPYPALFLEPDEVLRKIQSWPHPKGSEARPSMSVIILHLEEKTRGGQVPFRDRRQTRQSGWVSCHFTSASEGRI